MDSRRKKRKGKKSGKRKIVVLLGLLFFVFILVIGAGVLAKPTLVLKGASEIEIPVKTSFTDPGSELLRFGSKEDSKKIKTMGKVDNQKVGEYDLSYEYQYFFLDEMVKRKVKVVDNEPPVLSLVGEPAITLTEGTAFTDPGVEASDNYDQTIAEKIKVSGNVDTNTPGNYHLVYTAEDASGNTTSISRMITVEKKVEIQQDESSIIYLTFDDGPSETITPQVLKVLQEEKVAATFFVTGNGPDSLIKEAYDEGHSIGLHTFTHDYASVYQSVDAYYQDLDKIAQRVKRITGEDSKLVRFPGGSSNAISKNYCAGIMSVLAKQLPEKGYQYFDWNVSSGDGATQPNADIPYNNVTTQLKKNRGNIVLMHDTKQTSADAVKKIIQYGKEEGYVFKKLTVTTDGAHHGINN